MGPLRYYLVAGAVAVSTYATAPSASAAISGSFAGSVQPGLTAARLKFQTNGCTAAAADLSGTDAAIINVSSFPAGRILQITWNATVPGRGVSGTFFGVNCAVSGSSYRSGGLTPGLWQLGIPVGAKFLVIEGFGAANVSYKIN